MYSFDATSGKYTLLPAGGSSLKGLNALAYNSADNYLYAMASGKLYQISADGSRNAGVTPTGKAPLGTGADFIAPNKYLTTNGSGSWVLVDLTNPSAPLGSAFTATGTAYGAADIAYNPRNRVGYGMSGMTLYIAQFNGTSGVPTSMSVSSKTVSISGSSMSGAWGAAYVDGAGNTYFFNNSKAKLYEITADQLVNANPTATLVASPASMSTPNDGAGCNTASSPFAPNVTTGAVTGLSNVAATLDGTVSTTGTTGGDVPNGSAQICWSTSSASVRALLSNDYRTCSTYSGAINQSSTANLSVNVTGLTASTLYYYQTQATSSNGQTGYGQIKAFRTNDLSNNPASSVTVTFHSNDINATGSMAVQTGLIPAYLSPNAFANAGYVFTGWSTVAGVSPVTVNDSDVYDFSANLDLYAQWTPEGSTTNSAATVTFDANGGNGSMASQSSATSADLRVNSFNRQGWNFTGWNTAADGTGDSYADQDSYDFSADLTLYAQWQTNGYTVNFNSQGGSNFPGSSYTTGGCVDLPGAPTRAGYSFIGWFVAPDAHSNLPSPYCPGSGDGNITLYAHWAASVFPVHYNSQGGSPVADGSYNAGEAINLAAAPTRPGYNFGGWSLGTSGATVSSPHLPAVTGSITFYAIWIAANYTVTFDPNGGAPGATGSYSTGGSLPLAAAPTKAGQVFQGWFLATSGGSALTSPYTPVATGPVTLYAQWAPASYKVAFNPQGGSTVADSKYSTGGCVDLPAAPSRDGYVFNGWFAAETGGIALANPFCPAGTGDLSIYAQWTKKADPKPVARGPVTAVISGFADGSPALNKSIKKKIDAFLTKYSDYKVIQCVGFTEGPTVLKTDKGLSIARATNACAYALAGLGNGLKAKAPKFGNEQTESAQLRRVEITLSDN
jgi:uncharacterized repeat protein (TIGR02543 family)